MVNSYQSVFVMVSLRAFVLTGFGFFVLLNILNSALYWGVDIYESYNELLEQQRTFTSFCQEICSVRDAASRYGPNVKDCIHCGKVQSLVWPRAMRISLSRWHLCGVETTCMQMLAEFVGSWGGRLTMIFGIAAAPFAVLFAHDMVAARRDARKEAARRRVNNASWVEEVPTQPAAADIDSLLVSSRSMRRQRAQLEAKQPNWLWSTLSSVFSSDRTLVAVHSD